MVLRSCFSARFLSPLLLPPLLPPPLLLPPLFSPPTSSPLQVICIIVKNESDVSAFSNYQPPEQGGGATAPPSEPPQQVRVKSETTQTALCPHWQHCVCCVMGGAEGAGQLHTATCVIICGLVSLRVITCHPVTWHYLSPFVTFSGGH